MLDRVVSSFLSLLIPSPHACSTLSLPYPYPIHHTYICLSLSLATVVILLAHTLKRGRLFLSLSLSSVLILLPRDKSGKKSYRHCEICVNQHSFGYWTEQERWHGELRCVITYCLVACVSVLSVCLSACLSVCLSACLSFYLRIISFPYFHFSPSLLFSSCFTPLLSSTVFL